MPCKQTSDQLQIPIPPHKYHQLSIPHRFHMWTEQPQTCFHMWTEQPQTCFHMWTEQPQTCFHMWIEQPQTCSTPKKHIYFRAALFNFCILWYITTNKYDIHIIILLYWIFVANNRSHGGITEKVTENTNWNWRFNYDVTDPNFACNYLHGFRYPWRKYMASYMHVKFTI